MHLIKKLLILIIFFFTINCAEKTHFSGVIINDEVDHNKYKKVSELINSLGNPNFIDIIENKYYYYNQISLSNNLFKEEIKNRTILVFSIKDNEILSANKFNLDDQNEIKINGEKTKNNLLKTGIIKKIFGGVSPSNNLTNTSN